MLFTALLGNPVEHSISPYLFAEYAQAIGLEYSHLKIKVPRETDLLDYLQSLQRLGCLGVNVTLPYKLSVIKYLDSIDLGAKAIGAVNTVVMANNQMIGYNTDGVGAYRAIAKYLRPVQKSDRILILGSGGAARAIIYELYQRTENILILGRSPIELEKLADDFSTPTKQRLKTAIINDNLLFDYLKTADFVMNTTPIGMYPHAERSLISENMINELSQLRNLESLYAFDAIFNPHTTKMLQTLSQYNATVCSGLWMMIYQAVEAFQLWTGKDVSQVINHNFAKIEAKLSHILTSKY